MMVILRIDEMSTSNSCNCRFQSCSLLSKRLDVIHHFFIGSIPNWQAFYILETLSILYFPITNDLLFSVLSELEHKKKNINLVFR